MATRPSTPTGWANNPPGGSVTEPNAAQKASGWQPTGSAEYPNGKPVLQHMNWIQNNLSQWEAWLAQSEYVPGDIFGDQFLPLSGTNPPSVGAGLTITAGDFAAGGIAGGYRVPVTQGPAHTYSANSDTYWDLGPDGVWDANSVAAGDPAPTIADGHIRAYSVTTDSADRLSVNLDNTSVGTSGVESPNAQINIDTQLGIHMGHLELVQDTVNSPVYSLVARKRSDVSSEPAHRIYISNGNGTLSTGGQPSIVLTVNAAWNQLAGQWNRDSDLFDSRLTGWTRFGQHVLRHDAAMPAAWNDTTTVEAPDTWVPEIQIGQEFRLQAPTAGLIDLPDTFRPSNIYPYYNGLNAWRSTKIVDVTQARDGGGGSFSFGNPRSGSGDVFWQHTVTDASFGNVMFPLDLPHEATIVNIYVIYGGQNIADVAEASVWRRRISGIPSDPTWTRMQSGGSMSLPIALTAGELAISGIDTGVEINRREYQYGVWVEVDPNQACTVYGIRVVYDYRLLTL